MPLDTSIPLQVKTPEFNPLQQALQVAQFRYMNANGQAMQQQLDANRAVSAAYQQATDPTTGQVDNNKLMGIISQDPRAAYNMGTIAQGINTQRKQQLDISNTQIDNANKMHQAIYQRMATLDPNDPDFTAKVLDTGMHVINEYGAPPQMIANAVASIPPDPAGRAQWLQRGLASVSSTLDNLKSMQPSFTNVNTGPATVAVNTNPLAAGGVGSVGYTVQNGLSPSEAQSQGITLNQNGQPVTYTKGQMQAGEVPQLPGGGYATSPPLGASDVASGAAIRYNTLQTAAAQAKPMMQTYDLANQAVQGAIAAGKGSASIANARGTVQTILGAFHIAPTGDSVKDYQLAVNYLNSAADQAASSLGLSGSDSRLAAAKAGQPDPNNMNLPALQESIAHAKGLQQALLDRQQAATNFLAQNGNNTSQLPQFEAKWNQAFNPDVSYIRSLADPAQQQAAMQQLKAQGKLQGWVKDYQAMKALGAF